MKHLLVKFKIEPYVSKGLWLSNRYELRSQEHIAQPRTPAKVHHQPQKLLNQTICTVLPPSKSSKSTSPDSKEETNEAGVSEKSRVAVIFVFSWLNRGQQACLVCPEAGEKERNCEFIKKVEVKTSSILF